MKPLQQQYSDRRVAAPLALAFMLLALMLLAAPLAAQQNGKEGAKQAAKEDRKEGAKELFYNPSTGAASRPNKKDNPKVLVTRKKSEGQAERQDEPALNGGIHYWLVLEGVGKVTEDRVFRTGDRIQLHLRSNVDGYLTLWACDSSGRSQLLFPAQPGESNFVRAHQDYSPPGTIDFRPPPEDERLLIFFSQHKEDIPAPQNNSLSTEEVNQAAQPEGGKELVFTTEKKDPAKFGTYIVSPQGGVITKEIKLKHRAGK